jgi:hypothetical protein
MVWKRFGFGLFFTEFQEDVIQDLEIYAKSPYINIMLEDCCLQILISSKFQEDVIQILSAAVEVYFSFGGRIRPIVEPELVIFL